MAGGPVAAGVTHDMTGSSLAVALFLGGLSAIYVTGFVLVSAFPAGKILRA
jgi:hypothetical protein